MSHSLSPLILVTTFFLLFTPSNSFLGLPLLTCHLSCLTCTGPNANQCSTCLAGLLPLGGSCLCADGKYYAGALSPCQNCNSACVTCDGPATSDCLTCLSTQINYQGTCYPGCSSSQYFDTTALACASCDNTCLTCNAAGPSRCTSCLTATLTNGVCQCPLGQYTIAQGGCAACHTTCRGCSAGPAINQCTSCISGMILQSGRCICNTGTYLVSSPVSCQACNPRCLGCSGPSATECTSCRAGFELSTGQCNCPAGKFYDSASVSCLACYSRCSTCTGPSSNECTACKNNLNFASGQCNCPDGTYLDTSIMTCRPCDISCQTCSGPSSTQCSSCSGTLILSASNECVCSGGSCSCPSGYYPDVVADTCKPCNPICKECSGPLSTECTECRSDYTFTPNQCLCSSPPTCSCPTKTYYAAGTCESCHATCAECTGPSSNECSSCISGLNHSPNTCTCPTGTYLHPSLFCFPCHSTCETCSGPSETQCIDCKSGLTKPVDKCICPTSPTGKYFDPIAVTCHDCNLNCRTCSGPEADQCLSCASGKTLDNGLCLDDCNSNEYRMPSDHSCQPCDSTCLTCSGESSTECLSCLAPRTFTSGTCPDLTNDGCHYTCRTCRDSTSSGCLACQLDKWLVEVDYSYGYCADSCPVGYYVVTENSQVKCRQRIRLNNRLAYGPDAKQIELTFERDIRPFLQELMDNIEVAIQFRTDQPPIDFRYSLTLTPSGTSLMLKLIFYGHLLPRNVLRIKYILPSYESTDTTSNIYVVNKQHTLRLMEYFATTSTEMDAAASALSSINSAGTIANSVFSWTSSIFLRSVHALRSEIVEDMLGYFIFMNIDYTPNFVEFAEQGLGSFELLMPNLFESYMDNDDNSPDDDESTRILESSSGVRSTIRRRPRMLLSKETEILFNMRLDDREFLTNHGAATSLLLISFGLIIVVDTIKHFVDKKAAKEGRLRRYILAASCSLKWNFVVSHFSSEYQGFVFFSILQLVDETKPVEEQDFVTFIFGIAIFLLSTLAVLASYLVARRANMKLKELEEVKSNEAAKEKIDTDLKRIGLFFESFKEDSYSQLLYPGFMVTRCYGFGIVLAFLCEYTYVQVIYLMATTIAIIAYLAYVKPLKKKAQNTLTIVYESFFLAISTLALVLHVYNGINIHDVEARSWICLVMLSLGTSMIVLNMISLVLEILEFRKLFLKKKKVAPLTVDTNVNTKTIDTKPTPKLVTTGSLNTYSNISIPNIGSDCEDQPIRGIRKDIKNLYSQSPSKNYSDDENSTIQDKKETLADLLNKKRKPEPPKTLKRGDEYIRKRGSSNLMEADTSSEKIPLTNFKARGSQGLSSFSPKSGKNFDFEFNKLDSQVSSMNVLSSKQATTEFNVDSQNNIDKKPKPSLMSLMSRHQVPTLLFEDLSKNAQSNTSKFMTLMDLEGADSVPSKRAVPDRRNVSKVSGSAQSLKPPEKSQDDMKANSIVLQEKDADQTEKWAPPRSAEKNRLEITGNESILEDTVKRKKGHSKKDI